MVDIKGIFFKKERETLRKEENRLIREALASRNDVENQVNLRVAAVLAQMDPFEPLLKQFHGVFSTEYEHPEENLDDRGRLTLLTWAWTTRSDPGFKWLTEWIMNTQANETLKRAAVTPDRILYGRAQISCMILFVKEVTRLAEAYDEILTNRKPQDFEENDPLE